MSAHDPWWAPARGTRPVLTPRQVNRHRTRTALRVALVLTVTAFAGAWVLDGTAMPQTEPMGHGLLAHRQDNNGLAALCGPQVELVVRDKGTAIARTKDDGTANRARYATIVPFFGDYWAPQASPAKRFWATKDTGVPAPEDLLGWMRDGHTVAWYTTDADAKDVTALRDLTADADLNLIVVPWEAMGRGPMPVNRKIAYAVHGASQTCHHLSAAALANLHRTYGN